MIPSCASIASPMSMVFDCKTRAPISFAAAAGLSASASASARKA
jgi:hypothetical protein